MSNDVRKERVVPIRESLVYITGHWLQAVILQQMLYWSTRINTVNQYIKEEQERDPEYEGELVHGWIYKSANELREDLFRIAHEQTILSHLGELVEKGFLQRRDNPRHKWDHTYQYRVNLTNIVEALNNAEIPDNIELKEIVLLKNNSKHLEILFRDFSTGGK